jgi:hypothetical protein
MCAPKITAAARFQKGTASMCVWHIRSGLLHELAIMQIIILGFTQVVLDDARTLITGQDLLHVPVESAHISIIVMCNKVN